MVVTEQGRTRTRVSLSDYVKSFRRWRMVLWESIVMSKSIMFDENNRSCKEDIWCISCVIGTIEL